MAAGLSDGPSLKSSSGVGNDKRKKSKPQVKYRLLTDRCPVLGKVLWRSQYNTLLPMRPRWLQGFGLGWQGTSEPLLKTRCLGQACSL